MRRPMHRPSTIDKLDPELRHEVDRLRIEDGRTIAEIVAFLQTMGQDISKSAVGRHVRTLEDTVALLREKREMASAMVRQLRSQPEEKLAELAIELIQGSLVDAAVSIASDENPDPEMLLTVSRAQNEIAKAGNTVADKIAKAEARAAKRATEKALAAVDKVAARKGSGMTKATVDAIYAAVLGAD